MIPAKAFVVFSLIYVLASFTFYVYMQLDFMKNEKTTLVELMVSLV